MVMAAEDRIAEIRAISSAAHGAHPGDSMKEYIESLQHSADDLLDLLPETEAEELEIEQRFMAEAEAAASGWWDHLKKVGTVAAG